MPLYQYRCRSCHHRFERLERASAHRTTACPSCGDDAGRVVVAPALQFKGAGWYVTDYGRQRTGAAGSTTETTA